MGYVHLLTLLIKLAVVDALNELKKKISDEFNQLLCKVKKGYHLDYEFLLEEISFIDLISNKELDDKLSLTALQYYLNNKWQIVQS